MHLGIRLVSSCWAVVAIVLYFVFLIEMWRHKHGEDRKIIRLHLFLTVVIWLHVDSVSAVGKMPLKWFVRTVNGEVIAVAAVRIEHRLCPSSGAFVILYYCDIFDLFGCWFQYEVIYHENMIQRGDKVHIILLCGFTRSRWLGAGSWLRTQPLFI